MIPALCVKHGVNEHVRQVLAETFFLLARFPFNDVRGDHNIGFGRRAVRIVKGQYVW